MGGYVDEAGDTSISTSRSLRKLAEVLRAGSKWGVILSAASIFRNPPLKYPAF